MFIEEARLASRLGHANVVQVFEFDEVDGRYYIAMELVRGHHLGRVVERARERGLRLGLPRAVYACAEIAKALAYAHRLSEGGRPLGLVHRDVSPQRSRLVRGGEARRLRIARAMNLAERPPGIQAGSRTWRRSRRAEPWMRAPMFAWGRLSLRRAPPVARESEAATLAAVLGRNRSPPRRGTRRSADLDQ
jgi:serine/threonine-protein kinase